MRWYYRLAHHLLRWRTGAADQLCVAAAQLPDRYPHGLIRQVQCDDQGIAAMACLVDVGVVFQA